MRKVWDIHGGVHPAENKSQSVNTPIRQASIPAQLILPLSQHIGAPAEPVVTVGDHVLKGQQIASAKGFVSVPLHAPSSGEVIAIEERMIAHSSGMPAPCIVIQTDGKDEWIAHQGVEDFRTLDSSSLLALIREAGIAGMGGAGFPTAVKLSIKPEYPIDTLIINGTECEPYITADDLLMRERADQIIQGVEILQHIISPSKETLIGVEDNKPEAIAALKKAAAGSNIEIVSFPTKYPSGGEKQLIQILTGKEVPNGGLPAHIGIICQNVGTAAAVYRAIALGEPLISRITTVTGEAVSQQQNYEVLLGTPMSHLLTLSGFDASKANRLIMGGPMMGITVETTEAPVVKTTNCILVPTQEELPLPPPAQACIRCGMCAEACPANLLPQQLYWYGLAKDHERLNNHNLFDCIECGACSFVCPSNIPLVQYYRASKADIRQKELDQQKSEHSKQRFEAREARLLKQAQEKEAKRLARQKAKASSPKPETKPDIEAALASNTNNSPAADESKNELVQAAIERAKARKALADNPKAKLEHDIASLRKKITLSEEKLQLAEQEGSAKAEALRTSLDKLQEKLAAAQQQLAELD
jgi:electron transport complex protein RnfC